MIYDHRGGPLGGPANWSAGYMPAAYQATVFRSAGTPIVDLKPPSSVSPEQQRDRLDLLAKLNEIIAKAKASGDLTKLSEKWLKAPLPESF